MGIICIREQMTTKPEMAVKHNENRLQQVPSIAENPAMSAKPDNLVSRFPAGGVSAVRAPCPSPASEALRLENISHQFDTVTAADDINLSVEPEELL